MASLKPEHEILLLKLFATRNPSVLLKTKVTRDAVLKNVYLVHDGQNRSEDPDQMVVAESISEVYDYLLMTTDGLLTDRSIRDMYTVKCANDQMITGFDVDL